MGWDDVRRVALVVRDVLEERGLRGWALINNFAPSSPETVRRSPGLRSPAERLNGKHYHPEWLENLLASASLGGYRSSPRKP